MSMLSSIGHRAEAASVPSLGWRVQARPFRLSFTEAGHALTSEVLGRPGPGDRLSYQLADGADHSLTNLISTRDVANGDLYEVATNEPGRTGEVEVTRTPQGIRVSLSLTPSNGVSEIYEAWGADDAEQFLGSGERARYVDLAHQVVPFKVQFVPAELLDACDAGSSPMPFFWASAGWGVYIDQSNVGRFAFPGSIDVQPADTAGLCGIDYHGEAPQCHVTTALRRVQVCSEDDRLVYDLFAGDPAEVESDFTALAGRQEIPPPAQFGLLWWTNAPDQGSFLRDIADIEHTGVPLAAVELDDGWELHAPQSSGLGLSVNGSPSCVGTLRFDPKAFPDPKAMIDAVHSLGLDFLLWLAPWVLVEPGCPTPAALGYPPGSCLAGSASDRCDLDFTNPATLATFEERLSAVVALGVNGIKGDRGDETDHSATIFHAGPGEVWANLRPVLYAKAVTDVLRRYDGDQFVSMFRAGYAGTAAVLPAVWGGDQTTGFGGLVDAIHEALSAGVSDYPMWGSDIGGYATPASTYESIGLSPSAAALLAPGESPSPELFIRWAQFGAISAFMEVGGVGANDDFWNYPTPVVDLFRSLVVLHDELFPYLYGLAVASHDQGAPILAPVAFYYPNQPLAWAQSTETMVGQDLLAQPVVSPLHGDSVLDSLGGLATISSPLQAVPQPVKVYIPPGHWVDLFDGETLNGPRLVLQPTTLATFPFYMRSGTAIPFDLSQPDIWRRPWSAPQAGEVSRAGWMIAPGPGSSVSAQSSGAILRESTYGTTMSVELRSAPAEVQILVLGRHPARSVLLDGRHLPDAASATALRSETDGWTFSSGAFAGTLIKLHIHRPTATLTLSFGT